MCTGLEIALIAGTVISAGAQIQAGQQRKKAANFQAAQNELDAQAEREAAQVRAEKIRKQAGRVRGEAKADLAASGVSVDAGTPLRIDQEIVRTSEEEAQQEILYGGRRGGRLEQEAQGLRMAGANAQTEGYYGAASSVLAGGATYYGGGWRSRARGQQSYSGSNAGTAPRIQ